MVSKRKKASVLVCVTGQRDCDRLILAGKNIAAEMGASLQVLCVQQPAYGFCARSAEIEYLYQTTKEAGAEMTIYFHEDAALIAAGFVKQVNAKHIVTGMPDQEVNGFVDILHGVVPKITISMVSKEGIIYHLYPSYLYKKVKKIPAVG